MPTTSWVVVDGVYIPEWISDDSEEALRLAKRIEEVLGVRVNRVGASDEEDAAFYHVSVETGRPLRELVERVGDLADAIAEFDSAEVVAYGEGGWISVAVDGPKFTLRLKYKRKREKVWDSPVVLTGEGLYAEAVLRDEIEVAFETGERITPAVAELMLGLAEALERLTAAR